MRERPRERRLDDRNLDERMFPVDHPDHKVKVLSTRVPVWRFFRRRSCAPATAVLFKSNVADAGWQTRVLADRSRLPRPKAVVDLGWLQQSHDDAGDDQQAEQRQRVPRFPRIGARHGMKHMLRTVTAVRMPYKRKADTTRPAR